MTGVKGHVLNAALGAIGAALAVGLSALMVCLSARVQAGASGSLVAYPEPYRPPPRSSLETDARIERLTRPGKDDRAVVNVWVGKERHPEPAGREFISEDMDMQTTTWASVDTLIEQGWATRNAAGKWFGPILSRWTQDKGLEINLHAPGGPVWLQETVSALNLHTLSAGVQGDR